MTPSKKVKAYGFKSLKEFCEVSRINVNTAHHWNRHNPERFEVFCLGSLAKYKPKLLIERMKRETWND